MSYWSSLRKHIHLTEKTSHQQAGRKTTDSRARRGFTLRPARSNVYVPQGGPRIEFHGGRTLRRRGAAPTLFRRGGERASFGPAQLLRARDRARGPLRRPDLPRIDHLRDAGIAD